MSPPVYSPWGKSPSGKTLSQPLETTLARGREHFVLPWGGVRCARTGEPLQGRRALSCSHLGVFLCVAQFLAHYKVQSHGRAFSPNSSAGCDGEGREEKPNVKRNIRSESLAFKIPRATVQGT